MKSMEITLQDYETIKKDLEHNAIDMYRNPELGDEEYRAMRLLTSELEKHGFIIETNIVNRPTALSQLMLVKKKVRQFVTSLNTTH